MSTLKNRASDYKRRITDRFHSINPEQIIHKIATDSVVVTRKVDGEFNLLHISAEEAVLVNQNGVEKRGLPVLKKIAEQLKKKNITSLTAAVELHLKEDEGRRRIFELMSVLDEENRVDEITLSAFELLELDDEECSFDDYAQMLEVMSDLLEEHVVRHEVVDSHAHVRRLFDEWVLAENSEGLVVRSKMPQVYKVKPVHTLDLAIMGYSASEDGRIRSLLLAFMREDGTFQQVARAGSGLDEELSRDLYKTLSQNHVDSTFIITDKNNIAFHLVKPTLVAEIRVNDIITQTTKGPTRNLLLVFEEDKFLQQGQIDGVSFIHPVFMCIREDKKVNVTDVRLAQVNELVHIDTKAKIESTLLPSSTVLMREVYTKESKGSTMVQKFMLWKTNKSTEDTNYPEYVFCYINYSPTRKDPIKKEIRVSSSKEQIMAIVEEYKSANIKKGWEQHASE